MTGKHATKPAPLVEPQPQDMPDPDNLRIDLNNLPRTGPITLPRRN